MGKYLDKTGLSAFWQKIKDTFAKKSDIPTDYVNTTSAQDISGVKTFKDTFYLEAATPFVISKKSKVGMRASNASNENLGQFNITDSLSSTYNGMLGQMAVRDNDGAYHAIKVSGLGPMYSVGDTNYNIALTSDIPDSYTKTESDAKYLPLAGGSMTGNIYMPSEKGLLYEDGSGWGINDAGEPCLLNKQGRFLLIATTEFYDDYISYNFPEYGGTIALTTDMPYTHNIYIMPGTGAASGAYIILTLNVKGRSTAYTTVAQIAAYLYSKGHTTQQNCVMASGKCSTSSSTFVGFVVGVYASSSTTLNVVYVTTGGSITSVSYDTSLLTNMRDKVN